MRCGAVAVSTLIACSSSSPTSRPEVAACSTSAKPVLAEVGSIGYGAHEVNPDITVTLTELALHDVPIEDLHKGSLIDPEILSIPRLAVTVDVLGAAMPALAFDKRVPYRTAHTTLHTLRDHGYERVTLVALAGGQMVSAPIRVRRDEVRRVVPYCGRVDESTWANKSHLIQRRLETRHREDIVGCYDELASNDRVKQGTRLRFTVDKAGKPSRATFLGPASRVKECLGTRMAAWAFKPARTQPESFDVLVWFDRAGQLEKLRVDAVREEPRDPQRPIEVALSIDETKMVLWSRSNYEGSRHEPRLTLELTDPARLVTLQRALVDVASRRQAWDRKIELEITTHVPMQTVAEVIGAVRATPDGRELFPDVVLALGFE